MAVSVPVVLDHFGSIGKGSAASAADPVHWAAMLGWVRQGRAWVKLSAPYSVAQDAPDYASLLPLMRALADAGRDRLIFASNWPHTGQAHRPDTAQMRAVMEALMRAAGLDPRAVVGHNAEQLYA